MRLSVIILFATFLLFAIDVRGGQGRATVMRSGEAEWTLESDTLRAVLAFQGGSADLTSLFNKRAGKEMLSGRGRRCLFRHVVDGEELAATDGGWEITEGRVGDITVFGRNWGKSLTVTLKRPAAKLGVALMFEIYDGPGGLRYGNVLQNDDSGRNRTFTASDVLSLNLPDSPHIIDHVPWQTQWARTEEGLERAKRNALLQYADGAGLAVLPENNWCTSLKPGPKQGDPHEPFLFMNLLAGGDDGLRVFTNPKAVQVVLFPGERLEYFWVNLQCFAGDALAGRAAVAEHFRRSFKYHRPLPQMEFQEFRVEYFQNDAMAREHLLPALAEAGLDRWQVTWCWNGEGNYADDSPQPRPDFTTDLPGLARHAQGLGIRMGYYFAMIGNNSRADWGWGGGRDLADPRQISFKRKQVEDILIKDYLATWQMIDLGELWLNDQPTSYSHPSDNVYRKYLNLRRYMTDISRRYPGFQMLTTCETENPKADQGVSLLLIGENGQAGTYKRTDGAAGFSGVQANLRDAMNAIGLMPLEGFLQVHGEEGTDPWPEMFTPRACYAALPGGCSTYYSDVRRWTPDQRRFLRAFNDWRRNPRIAALLQQVVHPLATGVCNEGPYIWIHTSDDARQALLVAVGFDASPRPISAALRTLDPEKTYLIQEITLMPDGRSRYIFRGESSGAQLIRTGLRIDLESDGKQCAAYWIQEKSDDRRQILYADAAVTSYDLRDATVELTGVPGAVADVFIYSPAAAKLDRHRVKLDARGRMQLDPDSAPWVSGAKNESLDLPVAAKFISRDATTAGRWRGRHGSTAAWLAGRPLVPQDGYELSLCDGAEHVWGKDDSAARVPELPAGETGSRIAACWTAAESFDLSVRPPAEKDGRPYRLTIYLMDHANENYPARALEVALRDRDGKILDRQSASTAATDRGIYFTWEVTGPVNITVSKTAGINAAASAVFIDAGGR